MHTRYSSDEYLLTNVRGVSRQSYSPIVLQILSLGIALWPIYDYVQYLIQSYDINVYTIGQIARLLNQGKLPLKNNEFHKQSETQKMCHEKE